MTRRRGGDFGRAGLTEFHHVPFITYDPGRFGRISMIVERPAREPEEGPEAHPEEGGSAEVVFTRSEAP